MKNLKILTYILLSMFITTSCVDNDAQGIEGDLATTPYIIGFSETSSQAELPISGSNEILEVPINLINGLDFSGNPSIEVSYIIVPSSTAVAGTDYDLIDPLQKVTIEAGRDFGMIRLSINTNTIDVVQPKTLVLRLADPSLGLIGEQFMETIVEITGVCQSDLAGSYSSDEVSSSEGPSNITIVEIGENLYRISSMPFISLTDPADGPVWIEFSESCGFVKWENWLGGTLVVGSGIVDENDGSITFDSFVIYNGDVEDPNDIWFDIPNSSTYTPN